MQNVETARPCEGGMLLEEATVRVEACPLQDASSPRSSNTRFGSTRSPTIRFARASTSGHMTRVSVRLEGGRAPRFVSRARISRTRRSRCRVGRALTRFRSCVRLMPSWYWRRARATSAGGPPCRRAPSIQASTRRGIATKAKTRERNTSSSRGERSGGSEAASRRRLDSRLQPDPNEVRLKADKRSA